MDWPHPQLIAVIKSAIGVVKFCGKCLRDNLSWWFRWDIALATIAVVVEVISAALEETSPHKLKAAEYGVIIATISFILCISDLAFKKYKVRRERTMTPNTNPYYLFEWDFADTFGLICSILTMFSASLHYIYLSNGKQQPIQFAMIPLAFSTCVFCSRVFRQPNDKFSFVIKCEHLGPINLQIMVFPYNDGPIQFACPLCHTGHTHPSYDL